jgi:hypothetical protein
MIRLLSFNFNKVSAEKFKSKGDELKINNHIDISSVEKLESDVFNSKTEDMFSVGFKYSVNYEPGFAIVELKGTMLVAVDQKQSKEILKEWKNKNVPEEVHLTFINIILKKATVKAIQLEDELGFPLHIQIPRFSPKPNKK